MAVKRSHPHGSTGSRPARCGIVTVSDTRTAREDRSGDALAKGVEKAGHEVVSRVWVRDEVSAIRRAVRAAIARPGVDVVLVTGGSGVAPRDRTPEALEPLLDRELPGFGELFRWLSYGQVGSSAWLSRAGAGIAKRKLVVWLPGSTRAVELAVRRLIVPELDHVLRVLGRL